MVNDCRTALRICRSWFCRHEWVTCRRRDRVWLKCLHCESATDGISVGRSVPFAERPRGPARPWTGDTAPVVRKA